MNKSKFESIFKKLIDSNIELQSVIDIESFESKNRMISKVNELSLKKNNSSTIKLPESFKTQEAISRYYYTATNDKLENKLDKFT